MPVRSGVWRTFLQPPWATFKGRTREVSLYDNLCRIEYSRCQAFANGEFESTITSLSPHSAELGQNRPFTEPAQCGHNRTFKCQRN